MTTMDIAKKYVELVKKHAYQEVLETLFSEDAVSIEAGAPPGQSPEVKGLAAIAEKGKKWAADHEIHSSDVQGPWPNGDRFICRFTYEVTNKPSGQRFKMDEGALFTIENGKIVREEFFYSMG
jgi:ketosteroid isomerase-like protein